MLKITLEGPQGSGKSATKDLLDFLLPRLNVKARVDIVSTPANVPPVGPPAVRPHPFVDCLCLLQVKFASYNEALNFCARMNALRGLSKNRSVNGWSATPSGYAKGYHRNGAVNQNTLDARRWVANQAAQFSGRGYTYTDVIAVKFDNVNNQGMSTESYKTRLNR